LTVIEDMLVSSATAVPDIMGVAEGFARELEPPQDETLF